MIEGQPILGNIEANPDRLEQVLTAATQVANKSRAGRERGEAAPDADIPLELRIGTRIRRLDEWLETNADRCGCGRQTVPKFLTGRGMR